MLNNQMEESLDQEHKNEFTEDIREQAFRMKEVLEKLDLFEKRIGEAERNRMEKYYTQVA